MKPCDVAIVGAGPYGLSAAAYLQSVAGLDVRIFGRPMSFWECNMPSGMLLRSPWAGTHLGDPQQKFTLDDFQSAIHERIPDPIPLERFVEYGHWFQRHAVRQSDHRRIRDIHSNGSGFRLLLDDGEELKSRRVVIAAGIETFASRPAEFQNLPQSLVSHTCDHNDLSKFRTRRVMVVGGGQSALESAALLHEQGAVPEVVIRAQAVRFLWHRLHKIGLISRLLYAPPDVGPAGVSQLVARPHYFRRLPRRWQDPLARRSIRPAGAAWLAPRLKDVPITTGMSILSAVRRNDYVRVSFNDGQTREFDHILIATGYQVDVSRYSFVSRELLAQLSLANGYPRLNRGFEASVRGLHFLGAPAAWSFGPLLRFVAGADFAAHALTQGIVRSLKRKQERA